MGKEFIQLTGNDDNAFEFNKRGVLGQLELLQTLPLNFLLTFRKLVPKI